MTATAINLKLTTIGIGALSLLLVACNQPASTTETTPAADSSNTESTMMNDSNSDDTMMSDDEMMNDEDSMTDESTESMKEVEGASDTELDADVKVVEVEAGSFYYKPDTITVKKGQKVKIIMNSVSMMHDFNIDELNVQIPITKDGETNSVEFSADQVGEFEYYCSVKDHREKGQIGTLVVTE